MNIFSKNPFAGANNQTKIAGNYVMKKTDGGRVSLDSIRENMNNLRNPKVDISEQPLVKHDINKDMQVDSARMRMDALKNLGRK